MAVAEDNEAMNEEQFPIYRISANGAHVYRIDSWDRFTELQRIGKRWVLHEVEATMFPEKLRIRDMVDRVDGAFVPSTSAVWAAARATVYP
jgi:hypothetical protein